jgi:hypothetical protein
MRRRLEVPVGKGAFRGMSWGKRNAIFKTNGIP